MKMKSQALYLGIATQFLLATSTAAALECSSAALSSKEIHNLPDHGYWMQSTGDCRLTYTGQGGINSKMYNLCTRKAEPITDNIDAYGLPEGDIYVHPNAGMAFYKMSDAIKHGDKAQPFYTDPNLHGNYESIGTLPGSTPEKRLIRIAMGSISGVVQDYSIEKTGEDDFKVTPLNQDVVQLCKNIPDTIPGTGATGLDREIPIMSRDGQMIAARRLNGGKTEIFKFSLPSGDCTPIAKTPSETSKVTFSFDNKSIFYVMEDPTSGLGRLMKMDIATGKTMTLSGPDEEVFYATTKSDGSLFYTRRNPDDYSNSELVVLPPHAIQDVNEPKPFEAVGMAWGKACGKDLDLDMAFAVGMRMNKSLCETVVKDLDLSALVEDHKSLSKDTIAQACNQTVPKKTQNKTSTPAAAKQGEK